MVPWSTWNKEHPNTLILDVGIGRDVTDKVDPFGGRRGAYVAGVALGDRAKAYPFDLVSREVVVNDRMGELPLLVYANPADRSVHIFLRDLPGAVLEFKWAGGELTDKQTGTRWDPASGVGIEGPLRGEVLKELPYSSAYEWAWRDFYPHTEVYGR